MTTLNDLVENLIRQNPDLADSPIYLIVEAWRQQGLKLYPHQREVLLSGKLAGAEAIGRAGRRAKIKIREEDEARRRRSSQMMQHNKTMHVKVERA